MKVGDYLIFPYLSPKGKGKAMLGKVLSVKPLKVKTQPDDLMKTENLTLKSSEVFCVLGSKPKQGKAFGVDTTNIYRCTKPLKYWGDLHYFIAPDKQVRNGINSAFSIVYKNLKNLGIDISNKGITFRIKALSGKTNGMFIKLKTGDILIDLDPSKVTISELPHVLAHEVGHYLFNFLEAEQQEKWVKLYIKHIMPKTFSPKDCQRMKDFIQSYTSLKEAKSEVDDDDKELFDTCIKFVRIASRLSFAQLDSFYQSNAQDILDIWPKSISSTDYDTIISEYATKNYKELFAESFAFYVNKKELPQTVEKMMARTIQQLKVLI